MTPFEFHVTTASMLVWCGICLLLIGISAVYQFGLKLGPITFSARKPTIKDRHDTPTSLFRNFGMYRRRDGTMAVHPFRWLGSAYSLPDTDLVTYRDWILSSMKWGPIAILLQVFLVAPVLWVFQIVTGIETYPPIILVVMIVLVAKFVIGMPHLRSFNRKFPTAKKVSNRHKWKRYGLAILIQEGGVFCVTLGNVISAYVLISWSIERWVGALAGPLEFGWYAWADGLLPLLAVTVIQVIVASLLVQYSLFRFHHGRAPIHQDLDALG